jgi:rod shape-determining protein MreC
LRKDFAVKRFFKTAAFKTFAVVMAMLVAGSALSLAMRGQASPIVSAVSWVVSPLQSLCASAANAVQDFFGYFRSSAVLQAQLVEKEAELAQFRDRLVDYDKTRQKLELYEQVLELKEEHRDYKFQEASILGGDPAGQFGGFTLNRGSASGISVNDPVLVGKNLVGVVTAVEAGSCTVKTILNPDVHVIVYETATREIGWTNTTPALAAQGLLSIPELPRSTAMAGGGLVCTSSEGTHYPAELILGTVQEVRMDDQSLSATAIVKPAASFDALRDVFILIDF